MRQTANTVCSISIIANIIPINMSVDSDSNTYGCIRSDADETVVSTTFRLFIYSISA